MKSLENEVARQGDLINKLQREVANAANPNQSRRVIKTLKPGTNFAQSMESAATALPGGINQSQETRASVSLEPNEYLKDQLQGMVKLFMDFHDNFYFDLITETENPDIDMYRLMQIGESLMRYGSQMSET